MSLADDVRAAIRAVPDFPEPGILFRDISPLLADGALFEQVTDWMVERFRAARPTHVVGIESRGFLFGAPVAHRLGAGFVPARKPGKHARRGDQSVAASIALIIAAPISAIATLRVAKSASVSVR